MALDVDALPDFPWDSLVPYRERAAAHPDGAVDLSVGTPVDPTPALVREALASASDAHGYPTARGTVEVRQAVVDWFARRRGVPGLGLDQVAPTVGSKELVGLLPSLIGVGAGAVVVHPAAAYPTYDVGARLAGGLALATDDVDTWRGDARVKLVWVNSPSNPTGTVASRAQLAAVVAAAREIGAVVASDECYAELPWNEPWVTGGVPSILDPEVSGGDPTGLLAVYSLSKQSSMAGYRAAFVAGDGALVDRLVEARRHIGLIVPAPVQTAMAAALADDAHVAHQRALYAARRARLLDALEDSLFEIDASDAGLYLWVTEGTDAWDTVGHFAEMGIVVAPGHFYGEAGRQHVRVALTASDADVERACHRIANSR